MQNASLKDEIAALETQLRKSDQRAWASIVSANGTDSQPPIPPLAAVPTMSKNNQNYPPLCIRISAAPTSEPVNNEESLARYLSAEEAKARVTDALQKNTQTEGVKTIGVGTTKTGYIIRFQDETSKGAASKMRGDFRT
ncbi:hypothetical protein ACJ73_01560 [Blastomyces percursus]|uniref:Uncharacterized protein n=1 Tax=Blastomyces percursus TaxID=1658174 RepID=A0A1J9QE19_9EURO|nr:hypothetical protein ACJ73_01560 [Blastomyces percursus]